MDKTIVTIYYKRGNEPENCKIRIKNVLAKLYAYYPNRKIDNINDLDYDIKKTLTSISMILGYPNISSMLDVYGFDVNDDWTSKYILDFMDNKGEDIFIRYPIGKEPQRLKNKIDDLMKKINRAYPDKVIKRLQKEHKKWYEKACELRQILGYQSLSSFLEAYGYAYEKISIANYSDEELLNVVKTLKKRYKHKEIENTIESIFVNNPDLEEYRTALTNRANKLFNDTLGGYLVKCNLLKGNDTASKDELLNVVNELKRRYPNCSNHCKVTSLFLENPDLKKYEKDLKEQCEEIYGVKLVPYLRKIKVLEKSRKQVEKEIEAEYGKMFEMNKSKSQIIRFIGEEKEIEIPSFIKKINSEAFKNTKVKKITFEEGSLCKLVKESAFVDCKDLQEIDFTNCADIKIDDNAFVGCEKLELINA